MQKNLHFTLPEPIAKNWSKINLPVPGHLFLKIGLVTDRPLIIFNKAED